MTWPTSALRFGLRSRASITSRAARRASPRARRRSSGTAGGRDGRGGRRARASSRGWSSRCRRLPRLLQCRCIGMRQAAARPRPPPSLRGSGAGVRPRPGTGSSRPIGGPARLPGADAAGFDDLHPVGAGGGERPRQGVPRRFVLARRERAQQKLVVAERRGRSPCRRAACRASSRCAWRAPGSGTAASKTVV